jgi:hypothetical protein
MLKLDNVILEMHDNGKGNKVEATMDDYLAPLIEALALKHTDWKFEATYTSRRNSSGAHLMFTVERMKVTNKYEELGQVGLDYTRAGKRFYINNHRVENMRERGSGVKTTDLNKALRHVDKFFGLKGLDEKLEEAKNQAHNISSNVAREKYYYYQNIWRSLEEPARQFILKNMEAFTAATKNVQEIKKFPEALREMDNANFVSDLICKNKTYLVLIDGMNYSVALGNHPSETMASEQLPTFIRQGVGMLKLVEVGNIITNIGLRVAENTFVVLPPSEENHE